MHTLACEIEFNELHAQLCQALADPNRIGLLYQLADGPRAVTDLVVEMGIPQSTVSRHLRVLRDQRLVVTRRQGKMVYYELADPDVISALDMLRGILAGRLQAAALIGSTMNRSIQPEVSA